MTSDTRVELTAVRVEPQRYRVTIWPEELTCSDQTNYCVTVEHCGRGQWKVHPGDVTQGIEHSYDADGNLEIIGKDDPEDVRARHRFPLEEALDLARRLAPDVRAAGWNATESLARHLARHGLNSPPYH